MNNIVDLSKSLFSNFNSRNIKYCHWKSNEHLFEGLIGETDLDVFVSPDDYVSCIEILKNTGFTKFVPQFGSLYKNVEDWIGLDGLTGKLIHIHLHFRLITGHKGLKEYNLPWGEEILSSRLLSEYNVYIAEPNLELIQLFTRILLKFTRAELKSLRKNKYTISKGNIREITYLRERVDDNKLLLLCEKYIKKAPLEFFHFVKNTDLTNIEILKMYKIIKNEFAYCTKLHGIRQTFLEIYYHIAIALNVKFGTKMQKISRKTLGKGYGFSVALIGQDGAGKSTVSSELINWLNWKIDAKRFYLGSGDHRKSWKKTFLLKEKNTKNKLVLIIKKILSITECYDIAKHAYKELKKAYKYQKNGGIAIFDRFPQNQFVGINDGPKIRASVESKKIFLPVKLYLLHLAKKEEKLINKCALMQPNMVLKLILSPEESLIRKPEEDFDSVKQKHEIIKALSFPCSDVKLIDASMNYNNEICEIKNAIWSSYIVNNLD